METLEQKIGYTFRDPRLLKEALTHPSVSYEAQGRKFDNQRLEFLGDAVLQLVLTEELFERFSEFKEGRLTQLRSRLVSRDPLARFAEGLDLGQFLLLGKGEETSGGRERVSNLADAFEALVGALYLDGGLAEASRFVLAHCRSTIDEIKAEPPDEDNPKGRLQELLQTASPMSPTYHIVASEGPDHERTFTAEVIWGGESLGSGTGQSKQSAQIEAANDALVSGAAERAVLAFLVEEEK